MIVSTRSLFVSLGGRPVLREVSMRQVACHLAEQIDETHTQPAA